MLYGNPSKQSAMQDGAPSVKTNNRLTNTLLNCAHGHGNSAVRRTQKLRH